jgi:hypothetical protein
VKLILETDLSQRRGGIAATARQIGLAGHGGDRDTALASLRRVAYAWVMGLTAAGCLTEALARCGIRCDDQERDEVSIDLVTT